MSKHSDIPSIIYSNLRAVCESRVRRALDPEDAIGLELPQLTDREIFLMMPDHENLDWTEAAQPALMGVTLHRMTAETELRLAAS